MIWSQDEDWTRWAAQKEGWFQFLESRVSKLVCQRLVGWRDLVTTKYALHHRRMLPCHWTSLGGHGTGSRECIRTLLTSCDSHIGATWADRDHHEVSKWSTQNGWFTDLPHFTRIKVVVCWVPTYVWLTSPVQTAQRRRPSFGLPPTPVVWDWFMSCFFTPARASYKIPLQRGRKSPQL